MDTTTDVAPLTREQLPSADYNLARTPAEIDATYKTLFADAAFRFGGDGWSVPPDVRYALQEDARRAYVHQVRGFARRVIHRSPEVQASVATVVDTDAGPAITCRVCGETKPVNKYPTLRGGGLRDDECRACQAERRAKAKGEVTS